MTINKEAYLQAMCKNLITLRATLGLTQEELAYLAGISRQTIVSAERNCKLSWNSFLSLVFIFSCCKETKDLMDFWGIFPEEYTILFRSKQIDTEMEVC